MHKRTTQLLAALSIIFMMVSTIGCSVFISTPRTATIHIQGLDNAPYEYVIHLDEPTLDKNIDIRISNRYTIQLDFDWLWDSQDDNRKVYDISDEEQIPPLAPWMLCKYRF